MPLALTRSCAIYGVVEKIHYKNKPMLLFLSTAILKRNEFQFKDARFISAAFKLTTFDGAHRGSSYLL